MNVHEWIAHFQQFRQHLLKSDVNVHEWITHFEQIRQHLLKMGINVHIKRITHSEQIR